MSAVAYPHLSIGNDGHLRIDGTGIKVVMLATSHLAYGWDAEELQRQYPQLSLGQVHSALAYYYDHEQEMSTLIAQRHRQGEEIIKELGEPALRAKLRAMRHTSGGEG